MPILLWPSWLDWWADEENRRLLITVGVSLALHGGALVWWKSPVASGSMSTSAVTVFLPDLPSSSAASVALTEPLPPLPSLVPPPLPMWTPPLFPLAEAAKPSTTAVTPPVTQPATQRAQVASTSAADQSAAQPAPQAASQRRSDGVTVVLRVNADGKVTQIFWNRLPAISNEQLDRLEQIVRTRQFVPHFTDRTISEIIDVRALLNLPPAQSADSVPINAVPSSDTPSNGVHSAGHFRPDGLPVSPAPTGE